MSTEKKEQFYLDLRLAKEYSAKGAEITADRLTWTLSFYGEIQQQQIAIFYMFVRK